MDSEGWRLGKVNPKMFFKKKGRRNLETKKSSSQQVSFPEDSGVARDAEHCPLVFLGEGDYD